MTPAALVYDLLSRLVLVAVAGGVRLPPWREHVERLGGVSPELLERLAGRRVVWVHNASVGELAAAMPLLRGLRARSPDDAIVLSATSLAGRELAARVPEADGAFLLPVDAAPAVRRVLDAVRPSLFVFTETEIWPTLLRELGRRGVPAVLLSGRISSRSFPRAGRVRGLYREALANVHRFGMQSEVDAERMRALGAPPERIVVTGSLKLDAGSGDGSLSIEGDGPLWIAGSTHPGEERICLEVFVRLRERFPGLRLLLAPRHLRRLAEVGKELDRAGVRWARRSGLEGAWSKEPEALLLDTLGELAGLWRFATVAFVGGSLAPVGGHNLLEPARAGVPVLFGPHVGNVAETAATLETAGGGRRVGSAGELEKAVASWLTDPAVRAAAAEAAATAVPAAGVAERSIELLAPWLPGEAA